MKKINSLWVEKYRPETLDGYICSSEIKEKFQNYIDSNDIPHLLFAGSVGIGKTTAAKLLINNLNCDHIVVNASDERGIDVIRNKIVGFAQTSGFNPLKVVLLEEADKLTPDAQEALRFVTEQYSKQTRFIITCNYPELLTDALKSRFRSLSLIPPSLKEVTIHLANMLELESIKFDKIDLVNLVKEHYPDIRYMVKVLQDDSSSGEYRPSQHNKSSQKYIDEIINVLVSKKNKATDFTKIRQIVADAGVYNFIPLFKKLYSDVDKYTKQPASVMLVIADYIYKDHFVPDKEINAMACLIQIIGDIYG